MHTSDAIALALRFNASTLIKTFWTKRYLFKSKFQETDKDSQEIDDILS
jgi:hypothetical protein